MLTCVLAQKFKKLNFRKIRTKILKAEFSQNSQIFFKKAAKQIET